MPAIIAYLKSVIKKILPAHLKAWIIRMRGEKLKPLDLTVIHKIYQARKEELDDPVFLEKKLLPELGFNDEQLDQFPEELYVYCGKGLLHWQYPNQFSQYLILLSQLQPASYLEIGVRHGGTFIITLEYLKKFNPVEKAIAVDLAFPPSLSQYKKINPAVRFYQLNSQTADFKKMLEKEKKFDLVFIDGNHEDWACQHDFMNVKDIANAIAFHDIASAGCPGVEKLWSYVKENFSEDYFFHEFTAQYESVITKTGKSYFGIGLAVKRSFVSKI